MARQQDIDKSEYEEWRRATWTDYASCTVAFERLRWQTNMLGAILVTHGSKELYRGFAVDKAIEAWDAA